MAAPRANRQLSAASHRHATPGWAAQRQPVDGLAGLLVGACGGRPKDVRETLGNSARVPRLA